MVLVEGLALCLDGHVLSHGLPIKLTAAPQHPRHLDQRQKGQIQPHRQRAVAKQRIAVIEPEPEAAENAEKGAAAGHEREHKQ